MKKILFTILMILLFSSFALAAIRISQDMSSITGNVSNFTTYYGNGGFLTGITAGGVFNTTNAAADLSAGCTNRTWFSTANVTITVDSAESIQAAICANLPMYVYHKIIIQVRQNYSLMENITIPPYYAQQSYAYQGGQFMLVGYAGELPKVGSILASGITGEANPQLMRFNVTGIHPYYTTGSQVVMFGVQSMEMYDMTFSGSPATNIYGLNCYGSICKADDIRFENGTQYGFAAKQMSIIQVDNATGRVTKKPYYASTGMIFPGPIPTVTGDEGDYKALQGFVVQTEDSSYNYRSLNEIEILKGIEDIQFTEFSGAGDNFTDTDANGFSLSYIPAADKLSLRSKTYGTMANFSAGGSDIFFYTNTTIGSLSTTGTCNIPDLRFRDVDTGIGLCGSNRLSFITAGNTVMNVSTLDINLVTNVTFNQRATITNLTLKNNSGSSWCVRINASNQVQAVTGAC